MKHLVFWFDVVSPYAYLAFEHLPEVLAGCSVEVTYRPVLFAGLLAHWGQKGPAEIAPKRAWTYRQVMFEAHRRGIALQMPAVHPFNPLPLMRLALACPSVNRRVVQRVMRHVWTGGADPLDPRRLAALRTELAPVREPDDPLVKQALRQSTDEAASRGIFGVPTVESAGRLFWGLDALTMLRASLDGDPWFDGPQWDEAGADRPGVVRR